MLRRVERLGPAALGEYDRGLTRLRRDRFGGCSVGRSFYMGGRGDVHVKCTVLPAKF